MTLRIVGFVASLSAAALMVSAGETFAGGARGAMSAVPFVRPGVPIGPRPFAHHRLRHGFANGFWAGGLYYGGAPYGEPFAEAPMPLSTDVNYTYTYKQDVPWDWAHRYPPAVAPADRPYVPACSNQPVTVPGQGGEQTINVIRCY